MQFGTAPATDNVASFNGKVEIHTSEDVPEPGTILDPSGQVIKGQGWMARLSDKLSEPSGASKGFVAIAGVVPAAITLMITGALLLVGFGRSDQAQVEKIDLILRQMSDEKRLTDERQAALQKALDRIEDKFDAQDKRIRETERFIDRTGVKKFLEENK